MTELIRGTFGAERPYCQIYFTKFMLFNSFGFLFAFLPITLIGYWFLVTKNSSGSVAWLAVASLVFYAYWNVKFLSLLIASIVTNYLIGRMLCISAEGKTRRYLICLGVAVNLGLLAIFKYANWFLDTISTITGREISGLAIILPIGISFYTFTQIAYLVDVYKQPVKPYGFIDYTLFVAYFPHLIAGPILHHRQLIPQFAVKRTWASSRENIEIGIAVFTIGLSKKMLLADPLGEYADLLFSNVGINFSPAFFLSWFGTLAYTFQLYFDFSGYSDMAIGLSLLFGMALPVNFYLPYKATNMIEFWRRWHISLTSFLRDYLYIPLGGSRMGSIRHYSNLFLTMLLCGLWHGANWTFVLWGALHGFFLLVNHGWQQFRNVQNKAISGIETATCWAGTFLAVCFAWVLFRAESVSVAGSVYKGLLGLNGFALPIPWEDKYADLKNFSFVSFSGFFQGLPRTNGQTTVELMLLLGSSFIASLALPASARLLRTHFLKANYYPELTKAPIRLQPWMMVVLGLAFALCLSSFNKISPFLYFQF